MLGDIQLLRNAEREGVRFPEKKRYEDVCFNVISVTRGWVGVTFPEKKRYLTFEWPLIIACHVTAASVGKRPGPSPTDRQCHGDRHRGEEPVRATV